MKSCVSSAFSRFGLADKLMRKVRGGIEIKKNGAKYEALKYTTSEGEREREEK